MLPAACFTQLFILEKPNVSSLLIFHCFPAALPTLLMPFPLHLLSPSTAHVAFFTPCFSLPHCLTCALLAGTTHLSTAFLHDNTMILQQSKHRSCCLAQEQVTAFSSPAVTRCCERQRLLVPLAPLPLCVLLCGSLPHCVVQRESHWWFMYELVRCIQIDVLCGPVRWSEQPCSTTGGPEGSPPAQAMSSRPRCQQDAGSISCQPSAFVQHYLVAEAFVRQ